METGCSDWIVIGRFGRPHGLKGFISIIPFTDPPENLLEYSNWHMSFNGKAWEPIEPLNTRLHAKAILTQVKGYPTREDLAALTNAEIAIPASELPDLTPGDYYWHELIGMTVLTTTGHEIGNVKELIPTGSNDVLVVEGEKRTLIPYLQGDVIVNIDTDKQCITVNWDPEF